MRDNSMSHAINGPYEQGGEGQEQQNEAEGVDLGIVAVVEEIEHAEGHRFEARRHDEDGRFNVPEAEEEQDVSG